MPPPKADEIVSIVKEDIVSGRLPPGAVLRQEHLARSFRVSRTPVREALKRLHNAGLVSLIPNSGARVRTLSRDDLRETFVVRAELEGLAAELAAFQITSTRFAKLRAAEEAFAELSDQLRAGSNGDLAVEWAAANDAFHDVLLDAAGVRLLAELVRGVRRPFAGQLLTSWTDELDELVSTNVRQHKAVRELVETRSAAGARAVMQEHIAASGVLVDRAFARLEDRQTLGFFHRIGSDPFYLRGGEAS
ncbi:MAG TPA: GntR family transcriptional regulator [Gaiellaceae bacterium]|jgi:DNA-binding GntR family transcriptional regulator